MSTGVQFDEDKFNYSAKPQPNVAPHTGGPQYSAGETGGMAGWLMKKGWVKSPQSAQVMLLAIVAVNIIITIFMITYFL
jgi:hypothetical protein